jgi:hypothetical protein
LLSDVLKKDNDLSKANRREKSLLNKTGVIMIDGNEDLVDIE